MQKKFRSGDTVPKSTDYKCYDKKGRSDGKSTYLEKGETFPPTQHEGAYWEMEQ